MKRQTLTIASNAPVNVQGSIYRMTLAGCEDVHISGQFVDIAIDGLFLRRPISVCDWQDGVLTILYKVVGKGTALMADMKSGETLDVLTSLGNGFDLDAGCRKPVLIGGGIGSAPLYLLAKQLLERGVQATVILGFNTASEVILEGEFKKLGLRTVIATADGSAGIKGFVTDALAQLSELADGFDYDYFYSCGPMPMLRALSPVLSSKGEFSLEERMGCGTGICMGCSCQTLLGAKRICKDGPVFKSSEIEL